MDKHILKGLNETRQKLAKDTSIPVNYLLKSYHQLCEKQQREIESLRKVLNQIKETVYKGDNINECSDDALIKYISKIASNNDDLGSS